MAVEYIGLNGPDGMCLGKSATEKVAFFGTTPVVQQTTSTTATDAAGALAAVNVLKTALDNLGLTA